MPRHTQSRRRYRRRRQRAVGRSSGRMVLSKPPPRMGLPDRMKLCLVGYSQLHDNQQLAFDTIVRVRIPLGGTDVNMPDYRFYDQMAKNYAGTVFGPSQWRCNFGQAKFTPMIFTFYSSDDAEVANTNFTGALARATRIGSRMVIRSPENQSVLHGVHSPQQVRGRRIDWADDLCVSDGTAGPVGSNNTYLKVAYGWGTSGASTQEIGLSLAFTIKTTIYFQDLRDFPNA